MYRKWIGLIMFISIALAGCGPAPLTAEVLDPARGVTASPTQAVTSTTRPTAAPALRTPTSTADTGVVTLQPLGTSSVSATPESTNMTPRPTTVPPSDDASKQLIETARVDLAQRLSIDSGQITLIEFRNVTWSDGSLGCPTPGNAYIQILVEGYVIQLRAGQRIFQYHGGQGRDPFLCENPEQPLPSGGIDS